MKPRVIHADSREALREMPDASIDACVCDPPYALVSITKRFGVENAAPAAGGVYARSAAGFMGKKWDTGETAFDPEFWIEVRRVLKPGAHLIAFGGTRTYHRLVCAIEDAGFEIRDQLAWLFGSGFPKSHDVSKGIDKSLGSTGERGEYKTPAHAIKRKPGNERMHEGYQRPWRDDAEASDANMREYLPGTDAARQWQGWGTALKPAHEPICLARKPLTSPAVDVRAIVEAQLRGRGVEGEIQWSKSGARRAGRCEASTASFSTSSAEPSATSADSAEPPEVTPPAPPIEMQPGPPTAIGERQTESMCDAAPESETSECGPKSLPLTAGLAPAAANANSASSLSTTSTAAARRTEKASTAKSTINCAAKDSRPDTECFAGIATGLTGSTERVPINRLSDGSFVWPEGVPEFVPGRSLTVAANVLQHGTGALNIDASRVEHDEECKPMLAQDIEGRSERIIRQAIRAKDTTELKANGRWPANVIHDGSEEVLRGFPESDGQSGAVTGKEPSSKTRNVLGLYNERATAEPRGDLGSAARFFYTAKADADDRLGSKHPTVKPVDLMAYLIKLVTPPGGVVLDPFAGSGTTGMACMREGFECVLIEREAEYVEDIKRRIAHVRGDDAPLFAGLA